MFIGCSTGYVSSKVAKEGIIQLLKNGNVIHIHVDKYILSVHLSNEESLQEEQLLHHPYSEDRINIEL